MNTVIGLIYSQLKQRTVLPHDLLTLFLLDLRDENTCESLYADLVGTLHLSSLRRADSNENDWSSLAAAARVEKPTANSTKRPVAAVAEADADSSGSSNAGGATASNALSVELAAEQEGATWTREELEDARRLRVRLDARNLQAGATDTKSSKVNAICAEVRRAIRSLSDNSATSRYRSTYATAFTQII